MPFKILTKYKVQTTKKDIKYKILNKKNDEIHTAVTFKHNLSRKSTTKEVMVGSGLLSIYRERNSNCRFLQNLTNEHLQQ